MHTVCYYGCHAVALRIIEDFKSMTDFEFESKMGWNCLTFAIMNDHYDIVKLLFESLPQVLL